LWNSVGAFRSKKKENLLKQKNLVEEAEEANEFKRKAIKLIGLGGLVERGEGVHIIICGYIFTPKNEHDENTKNV